MTPCVVYTRVSSDEQAKAGYSFPFQRQRIDEYARRGQFLVRERFEEAHSAKDTGRPEFNRMLQFLADNREVRAILVHKQDRIARNLTDWAFLMEKLKVRVVCVDEPVADTPMGWLTQTFGAAMAKFYSDNLSAEVRKGLRGKFEQGGCLTRAPVGYTNVPRTRGSKASVVVDPETAPLIRRMFEEYATGTYSLAALADLLFDAGLRTKTGRAFPKERVRKLLRHPFYKGFVRYGDAVRPGAHEPLVSAELWEAAQGVLEARHANPGDKGSIFFLLRGLLWCAECGRRFTAERHPKGSYYCCMRDARRVPCLQPYVPVVQLDADVEALLGSVALPEQAREDIDEALGRISAEHAGRRLRDEQRQRARLDQVEAKLFRLASGFGDGTLPREQYVPLRDKTEAERHRLASELLHLSEDIDASITELRRALATAAALPTLYARAEHPEEKKAFLARVIARIEVRDRTITRIEYRPPFELLLDDTRERAGSGCDAMAHALLDETAISAVS